MTYKIMGAFLGAFGRNQILSVEWMGKMHAPISEIVINRQEQFMDIRDVRWRPWTKINCLKLIGIFG